MNFKEHSVLKGTHAKFSPSKSSWLGYSDEKFMEVVASSDRKDLGTELHAFASTRIKLAIKYRSHKNIVNDIISYLYGKYIDDFDGKIRRTDGEIEKGWYLISHLDILPEITFDCLMTYINDAIAFRMTPEVVLYYSDLFYGTTDAICYDGKKLQIHDLKTGDIPAHIQQLETYAALFCLEYEVKPGTIQTELRIYQGADVVIETPPADIILPIMDKIVHLNKVALKNKIQGV